MTFYLSGQTLKKESEKVLSTCALTFFIIMGNITYFCLAHSFCLAHFVFFLHSCLRKLLSFFYEILSVCLNTVAGMLFDILLFGQLLEVIVIFFSSCILGNRDMKDTLPEWMHQNGLHSTSGRSLDPRWHLHWKILFQVWLSAGFADAVKGVENKAE